MISRLPPILTVLAVALLAACAPESSTEAGSIGEAAAGSSIDASANADTGGAAMADMHDPLLALRTGRDADAIAGYADRGELVGYDSVRSIQRRGAHTFYPVRVSEAHALDAIGTGTLRLTGPDGRPVQLEYQRHVEHPSGDWSWIGRDEHGIEGILTFGEKAVFGVLPYGEDDTLRVTTNAGQTWMASTASDMLSPLQQRIRQGLAPPDFRVPPRLPDSPEVQAMAATATELAAAAPASMLAAAAADTTIDVLLGYTPGVVSMLGGASQVQTRLNHIITVGNQAFINSNVAVSLRLVSTLQVNYTDTGANKTALEQLTGSDGTSNVSIPASLQPLRNARETHGADLVSLVRRFRDSDHGSCGIAWLIGGDQSAIVQGHERFGYSVISDSNGMQAPDNGHYCRDETLVHEIGHNLGSQHDEEAAWDEEKKATTYGRYPWSFGLKTTAAGGNFYTVMAYGDAGQAAWRVFSNPQSTYCGGRPCGVANETDNARSLRATTPIIAGFRNSVVAPSPLRPNLFAIRRNGTNSTEVHILGGIAHYSSFTRNLPTALGKSGSGYAWAFRTGDYNRDGIVDLYAIKKFGSSGYTEVHVLNGATNYSNYLLQVPTLIGANLGNTWMFDLADYNNDGILDLYAIKKVGSSGRTEVHVLNGANRYRSFLLQTATAQANTGSDLAWKFEVGDYNGDGVPDLWGIRRNGTAGRTEVHILDGANRFQRFLLQRSTPLGRTGHLDDWDFKLGDYDGDGRLDLYVIRKNGGPTTEVHVLDGAGQLQTYLTNRATALGRTGIDGSWQFDLVGP
ncbi:reprolysin-like metallopeptidase [Luteimonas changyuni]|uniref:reprolysin-like metallopeptidase n=1 Tax=Luteimonas sp. MJ145 TaxID=3129234 RepID=UPI0031BB7656